MVGDSRSCHQLYQLLALVLIAWTQLSMHVLTTLAYSLVNPQTFIEVFYEQITVTDADAVES